MPNGRFISYNLGDSEKFAKLASELHRVAYMLLVTWSDEQGRFIADPVTLRGKLYTRLPWSADEVEAALRDMHRVKLVRLYEADGKRYGVIEQWHEHQKIRRDEDGKPVREGASKLPEPPQNCGSSAAVTAAVLPLEVEVEVEVKAKDQVKDKDHKRSSTSLTRATDHTAFLEAWNYHRGALPAARSLDAKRKRGIEALRKEHGDDALSLFTAATQCVATDDYWVQQGYGLDNLLRAGRVLEKAEKFVANQGMSAGDRKLATTASVIARAIGGLDA